MIGERVQRLLLLRSINHMFKHMYLPIGPDL